MRKRVAGTAPLEGAEDTGKEKWPRKRRAGCEQHHLVEGECKEGKGKASTLINLLQ